MPYQRRFRSPIWKAPATIPLLQDQATQRPALALTDASATSACWVRAAFRAVWQVCVHLGVCRIPGPEVRVDLELINS